MGTAWGGLTEIIAMITYWDYRDLGHFTNVFEESRSRNKASHIGVVPFTIDYSNLLNENEYQVEATIFESILRIR